ncbi:MAG: hypothetical protein U0487_04030 [Patescibacteria group bacterium]
MRLSVFLPHLANLVHGSQVIIDASCGMNMKAKSAELPSFGRIYFAISLMRFSKSFHERFFKDGALGRVFGFNEAFIVLKAEL